MPRRGEYALLAASLVALGVFASSCGGAPGDEAQQPLGVPARLLFTVPPVGSVAGAPLSPSVRVEIVDSSGERAANATDEVTLSFGSNPTGTALTGIRTVAAVNGVATFDVSVAAAGGPYTLVASSGQLEAVTSAPLFISLAPGTVTFRNGLGPVAGYQGVREVALVSYRGQPRITACDPDTNYSTRTQNNSAHHPGDSFVLTRFDLSALPTGATIEGVEFAIDVVGPTAQTHQAYEILQPVDYDEVTWRSYRQGSGWAHGGATGLGVDRATTALLGPVPSGTGPRTVSFNPDGIAAVQRWVGNPSLNHGFLIEMSPARWDNLMWKSGEATPATARPRLRVIYDGGTIMDFQNGVAPSAAYAGMEDTSIGFGPCDDDDNINGAELHWVHDNTSAGETFATGVALLSFDVALLPPSVTVTSASVGLFTTDPSSLSEPLFFYPMLRAWSDDQATWNSALTGQPWSVPGAEGAVADRESTQIGAIDPLSEGPSSTVLSSGGLALIEGWASGAVPNHGLALSGLWLVSSTSGAFRDSEALNPEERPALTVSFTADTRLFFIQQPSSGPAGSLPPISVAISEDGVSPDTSAAGQVTLYLYDNPTGGRLVGTVTQPVVAGVATFENLVIDRPGLGYTVVASMPTVRAALSAPFDIPAETHRQLTVGCDCSGAPGAIGAELAIALLLLLVHRPKRA